MTKHKWITTTGGPIVILSKLEAKNWSGCFSKTSTENQKIKYVFENDFLNPDITDYGKACQIEDELGTFEFGKEKAIILSGEPNDTTYLKLNEKEFLMVRWIYADSEEIVNFYLQSDEIKNIKNWKENEEIKLSESDYVVFDSAEIGFEIKKKESIEFSVESGLYQIKTADFKPNDETFLLLHKFEKVT